MIAYNKSAWNLLAKDHYEVFKRRLEKDPVLLSDVIVKELGDIKGKKLIHLQCNVGQDTLSLANLGAEVTGVDLAPENIKYAKLLAEDFKIKADYVEADIMELDKLDLGKFDIVFTSEGAIGWLPDLNVWARAIRKLLKDDGFFYVNEIHPFFLMLDEEDYKNLRLTLKYPYFNREMDTGDWIGGYASDAKQAKCCDWMYSFSDIINPLIEAGLSIEYLHEHDTLCYRLGQMQEVAKSQYRFDEHKGKLPLGFSVKATIRK